MLWPDEAVAATRRPFRRRAAGRRATRPGAPRSDRHLRHRKRHEQLPACDVRRGALRLGAQTDGRAVAAILARAANDAAASSALARGVVAALGHVAFFAPDLGFDVVLGARGDALAAHEVAALCERAVALGEGASDATAVLARVKNLTRPAPSPSQSQ